MHKNQPPPPTKMVVPYQLMKNCLDGTNYFELHRKLLVTWLPWLLGCNGHLAAMAIWLLGYLVALAFLGCLAQLVALVLGYLDAWPLIGYLGYFDHLVAMVTWLLCFGHLVALVNWLPWLLCCLGYMVVMATCCLSYMVVMVA